jgi:hypothetical protein
MTKTVLCFSLLAALGLSLAACFLTGCEVQSADARIWITPSSAVLAKGESQTFTAHGGFDYAWSLQYPELGILSTDHGETTTYTCLYEHVGSNNLAASEIQTLTVNSFIPGAGSGGSASNAVSAEPIEATAAIYPRIYPE